jgi:hypothetical protein
MAIIRSYNQPTVEAHGILGATLPGNAPLGTFGSTLQMEGDAKVLLVAEEQLGRASDAIDRVVRAIRQEAVRARK